MRKYLKNFIKNSELYRARALVRGSFIERSGWLESFNAGAAVDATGKPIPWISYPAFNFLKQRLPTDVKIFEFGAGNSTLWFSNLGCKLTSVEHDSDWFQQLKTQMPSGVNLIHKKLDYNGDYSETIRQQSESFDLVVVDGRDRSNCALKAVAKLTKHGCILWDDSDRIEYQESVGKLISLGFKKIDFVGLSPIFPEEKTTSIFYRECNIFGL